MYLWNCHSSLGKQFENLFKKVREVIKFIKFIKFLKFLKLIKLNEVSGEPEFSKL